MQQALEILENDWKKIADKWLEKGEPLTEDESEELQQNIDLLKQHLISLHTIKTSLKTLGSVRKELMQIKVGAIQEKPVKLSPTKLIKNLEKRKGEINQLLYNMHVYDYMMKNRIATLDDYREISMPLPSGFMCHKAYEKELDFIKKSISDTKKDVETRREMMEEESGEQTTSINSGLDNLNSLHLKLYQFLEDFRPINAEEFHKKYKKLIQVLVFYFCLAGLF